jgi:hypothetical protein
MDMFRLLLPYWRIDYQTDLTYEQIGQRLLENVLTGFSLYSRKPYYGSFTPQGFSVRRPWGRFKTTSLAPSVKGSYGVRNGTMVVTLSVTPHPIWVTLFVLFVAQGIVYWLGVFPKMYQTWDISLLFRGLIPLAIVYGLPRRIFQSQCSVDLRFWSQTLQLREIAG